MSVKYRRTLMAGLGVAMAMGSLGLTSASAAVADTSSASAKTKGAAEDVITLGFSNRPNSLDSEFRYDGIVTAPKGVGIQGIRYSFNGNGIANVQAREVSRGKGGMGEEYEIVGTTTEGGKDKIDFTLRGDFGPGGSKCPTTEYPVRVEITLTDGTKQVVTPVMDMRYFNKCDGQSTAEGGRPVARLPWDNAWRSPSGNSQDGWGYITDTGKVPGDRFIIDASNPRYGSGLPCDITDKVYYQWVKWNGDGTYSATQLTPKPEPLNVTPHGNDWTKKIEFQNATDFTKDGEGYYKLLAWPQASSSKGQACQASWDYNDQAQGFQVGSVFYKSSKGTPLADPLILGGAAAAAAVGGGAVWYMRRRRAEASG
ncbi:hypothetical protein ACFY2W_18415 [Streptomyces sp. NPDC001262]|uniref:hypothetical protein n=1 Tax=Streptomyces sp. NPDC001262 TaxID=3364552 RepID=UPI003696D133